MSEGYIYCISNECMPGIFKVGMTERTPVERLKEANKSDTWRPPIPYKLEFAKRVQLVREKEGYLHRLLSKYHCRINESREFFKCDVADVRLFFDILDGEYWAPEDEEEDPSGAEGTKRRDMRQLFSDKQRIRHIYRGDEQTAWIGIYDSVRSEIECGGVFYKTLSEFATAHVRLFNPDRATSRNG
jgi:hypothetical protein